MSAPDIREAIRIRQRDRELSARAVPADLTTLSLVTGADVSYTEDTAFAAAVTIEYPGERVRELAKVREPAPFPYIPGLLAFREGPSLCHAIRSLDCHPQLLILNGHGYAHPARFGLASHLGFRLGIPSIGVASRPMAGMAVERVPDLRGACSPVSDGGECVGMAVRTRPGSRPLVVSAGFRTTLDQAVRLALSLSRNNRLPAPLAKAHALSRKMRRGESGLAGPER
jgi:deoxyribonuclease V